MKPHISPEEKLLRLIKGERKKPAEAGEEISRKKLAPAVNFREFAAFFTARRAVTVILVLSCLYLVFTFIYPLVFLKQIKLPEVPAGKTIEEETAQKTEAKTLDSYLEAAAGKEIFSGVTSAGTIGPVTGVNADLVKDLNLVGVITGDNPQAIIEDKRAQKTYYLNKGQFIGEFQIDDVQEGKVILDYQGQKFELHL